MEFQKIFRTSLNLSCALLPLVAWVGSIQSVSASANSEICQAAITESVQTLERVPNAVVEFSNIDRHGYQRYPDGRSHQIKFGISGVGIDDILNSPIFLRGIASQIIGSCDTLGVVGFGKFQADRGGKFLGSMPPAGDVKEFECVAAFDPARNPTAELAWGSVLFP